jgi:arabinofuranan 3-O-arabinosyltransferase
MNALRVPGIDFVHVWNAAHQFVHSGGAYADPLFTYPPGSALVLAPVGLLGYGTAKSLMVLVNVAAVLTAAWLATGLLQGRRTRRAIALGLLGLGVADAVASTWANGNVNGAVLLLEVFALRAMCRGSWMRAAVLLGISFTLKPVLLPLLVVLALRRHWRELAVAILVPAAGTLAGCAVVRDSSRFFTVVVPFLAHGAQLSFNDSLVGVGNLLRLPDAAVWTLRAGVGAALLTLLVHRYRQRDTAPSPQRLCYETGLLLAAGFLLAPMSETYYTIYLLPAVAAWAIASRPQAWAATVFVAACFATFRLPGAPGPITVSVPLALRPTLGWLLCLVAFGRPGSSSTMRGAEISQPRTVSIHLASPAAAVE